MGEIIDAKELPEFDGHVRIIACDDPITSLKGFIAIHRGGTIKPAFGATRIWTYNTADDALRDSLKLSRIMSYKSALAGFPYGGAKAVLIAPAGIFDRSTFITSYANFLNTIPHKFMTGADVGVSPDDVATLAKISPNIVGTVVDPVKYTIDGLVESIKLFASQTFAIQGLGKVGFGLLQSIHKTAKHIFVSDVDAQKVKEAIALGTNVTGVGINEIYEQKVDIFSPCALSNTINNQTINKLACKIILGSANAQLENDEIGDQLYQKGILYAPDYIVNAGGLIAVVSEYEKNIDPTYIVRRITTIKSTLKKVLNTSTTTHTPPHRVANEMAKKISDTSQ